MAITAEEKEWLDRHSANIEKLIEVAAEAKELKDVWDARNYTSAIDATDITDWGGHGFSVVQLENSVGYMNDLTQFLDDATTAVSATDRRDVIDKVRKLKV